MKLILIFVLASTFGMQAFSQDRQLAKSEEEYTKMFHNTNIKMVRSHSELYTEAKKNKILWNYFKEYKFAAAFLKELKFCKDGLITINLGVKDAEFEAEVGRVLGFEKTFWAKWEKGYACSDGDMEGGSGCDPSSPNSKCNTKNCGKAALKGDLYNPAQVLGS